MHVTLLGLVLVPVTLLCAYQPVRLLQVALIAGIFEAAAALVFGSFGLQPAMVPGLFFILYVGSQYALGMRYPGEAAALRALLPLLALLLYAVISAWLLPHFFEGQIFVSPQKPDPLAAGVLVPLEWTFGNVTQTLYLVFNVVLAGAVAVFLTRAEVPYERIIAAYLLGGYVVVLLVFWQFANHAIGVPFPDELLHSNPGWAIVDQALGSVPRLQGPFSEPAGLAGYMSGIVFCCLWLSIRGYRILRPNLLLALSIASTLLSTSTTGIVTLCVGMPITIILASIGAGFGGLRRIGRTLGLLLLGGVLAIGPVALLKPSLITSVSTVVDATLDKQQGDSYTERSALDAGGLNTVAPTFGLGVGWGSYRSSSFVPGLLANGGIFGVLMVLLLAVRVVRLGRKGRMASPRHPGRILVDGFSAALCTQLFSALIASPMISSQLFFLQLGCVVGVLARMSAERHPRAAGTGRQPFGRTQAARRLAMSIT